MSLFGKSKNGQRNEINILFYLFLKISDGINCNNYREMSLLPNLFNECFRHFSLSIPHATVEENIEDQQYEVRQNISITDHLFCIRQILDTKQVYKGIMGLYQLLVGLTEASGSGEKYCTYLFKWL
jgi:hypothetical protein